MAEQQYVRQTAHIISAGEFLTLPFVKKEGMEPSYLLSHTQERISRVNILGTVLEIQDEVNPSIIVDDGTGRLRARAFEEMPSLKHLKIGDACIIIGKPREFSNENYVVPEIIRKVQDKRWIEWRKLQLLKRNLLFGKDDGEDQEPQLPRQQKLPSSVPGEEEVYEEETGQAEEKPTAYDKLFSFIKQHDKGEGVEKGFIITASEVKEAEPLLDKMLREGEIFEIRPGRVKVL